MIHNEGLQGKLTVAKYIDIRSMEDWIRREVIVFTIAYIVL
jgi:hypothetical protein